MRIYQFILNMNNRLETSTKDFARVLLTEIANKKIKADSTAEGRGAQRYWYKEAQKMLKNLIKTYRRMVRNQE